MLSDVEYESFLVMLASHDAEWSRQIFSPAANWTDSFLKPARELSDNCGSYKKTLKANHLNFCKANGKPDGELADYFFDPLSYLPLGHADIFSITLLDDFDPAEYLTTRMRTTLEKVHLGFVPKMNAGIGVNDEDRNFCDLKKIWELKEQKGKTGLPSLLVFSKLKMDGLASLGLGFSFQSALWRTMVVRARDVIKTLYKKFPDTRLQNGSAPIAKEDVEGMKCCFLDLQGCEEIGILFFCDNLSVAFSIIRGFRKLTFEDVFKANPDFAQLLNRSKLHRSLVRNAVNSNSNPTQNDYGYVGNAVCDNHVFRWTDSSVGVLPAEYNEEGKGHLFPNTGRIHGLVSAASRIQVLPGHCSIDGELTAEKRTAKNADQSSWTSLAGFSPYAVGVYDTVLQNSEEGLSRTDQPLVRLQTVVDVLNSRLYALYCSPTWERRRDLVNIETELIVPVPNLTSDDGYPLTHGAVGPRNFAFLALTLSKLVQRLCYQSSNHGDETPPRPRGGALDVTALLGAHSQLGIPVSLRRAIRYLYQNYAVVLANPLTFDAVLDLYDSMATFRSVLAGIEQNSSLGTAPQGRLLLDEGRVDCLAEITDALHDAMHHHTSNAFRDISWRDMAVDFRGGLNQILFAADVPLKCGLGVVRRFASDKPKQSRNTVGCMMRITFRPGVRCCKVNLGIEEHARLSFLDVDAPHILHAASYGDYLHEAFHLVFEESVAPDSNFQLAYRSAVDKDPFIKASVNAQKHVYAQIEEIFTQMLWRLFVFGDDIDTFIYHCVLTFSRDIASAGADIPKTCFRFTEVMIRLFLASDCSRNSKGDPRFWDESYSFDEGARERFEAFLRKGGRYFSGFKRLWENDQEMRAWNYSMSLFDDVYARIKDSLPIIWKKALQVYKRTITETFPGSDPEEMIARTLTIREQIKFGLENGHPLISNRYDGLGQPLKTDEAVSSNNLEGLGMDVLAFICLILRQYIGGIKGSETKEVHLRFIKGSSQPTFEGIDNWWDFQADNGATALFCPVPNSRRERLLRQITMIKSFWDVASELRARRLLEMLTDNGL